MNVPLLLTPGSALPPDAWIDDGLLVENGSGMYELAQPALIPGLRVELSAGGTMEHLAMQATLLGWDGAPSAGHLCERYILRRLVEERVAPFNRGVRRNARRLVFGAEGITISPIVAERGEEVAVNSIQGLKGELFNSFRGETGIDGLIFEVPEGRAVTVLVDAIQVKTGRLDREVDSREMKAIVEAADAGWRIVRGHLTSNFRGVKFQWRSFTIVTSKEVQPDAQRVFNTLKVKERHILGKKVVLNQILDEDMKRRVGKHRFPQ